MDGSMQRLKEEIRLSSEETQKIDKIDGFEDGTDSNHLNGTLDDFRMRE